MTSRIGTGTVGDRQVYQQRSKVIGDEATTSIKL
jgi:hypothetical protein